MWTPLPTALIGTVHRPCGWPEPAWEPEFLEGGATAHANGRYVCAENAGASWLIADRAVIGSWEQFDLI